MKNTKKLTTIALLAALSVLLVMLVHFPIFPAAPFMEYDPADIPIFIGTFMFGPTAGVILTVVASIVQGLTVSAGGGEVGVIMHILATGAFAIVAGNIYKHNRSRKGAAIALLLGVVTMTVVMAFCNIWLTPIYMKVERSVVLSMLLPVIIPFNLIKAGANAIITMVVYKKISKLIDKFIK